MFKKKIPQKCLAIKLLGKKKKMKKKLIAIWMFRTFNISLEFCFVRASLQVIKVKYNLYRNDVIYHLKLVILL